MAYVNLMTIVYPVGSIYQSMNNISPSTLFGGTWVRITNILMPVAEDMESKTVENTKTKLYLDETQSRAKIGAVNNDVNSLGYLGASNGSGTTDVNFYFTPLPRKTEAITNWNHHTPVYGVTQPAEVVPPHITCYAWYRDA